MSGVTLPDSYLEDSNVAMKPVDLIGRRQALIGLGGGALVAGCDSVLPGVGKAPRLYNLTPKSTFLEGLPPVDWQLLVETPYASASLNTARIGLMPEPTRFDYYALANWTDREAVGLKPDFVLKIEIREFQAEAYRDPTKHEPRVGLSVKLVEMPDRLIVAAATFDRQTVAAPDVMSDIVQAWDDALGAVLKRLVNWTLEAGDAAWSARTRPRIRRSQPRRFRG
jgi:cholesterol transport system auxiliary component